MPLPRVRTNRTSCKRRSPISTRIIRPWRTGSTGSSAAIRWAFRNPELFSKAGGHSPTLFTDVYVTPEITAWMFPDEAARKARDPMRLAQTRDLSGLQVFLDTGPADVNAEGCQALYDLLVGRGVTATLEFLTGTHGLAYCRNHMGEYLQFYGAK
ncbi:MAG TPA: alpha/beta hydrolase-fold protein [Clostridia bacterium]|nr:alpha/beta hydrolase-fold protein [Clostridia bacterium]